VLVTYFVSIAEAKEGAAVVVGRDPRSPCPGAAEPVVTRSLVRIDLSAGRKGVGVAALVIRPERWLCSSREEFPWWKAPRVRLSVLPFREGVRGAALQGVPSASKAHRADSFGNEAHTAGPSSYVLFQSWRDTNP
jgi:hypothetical protein